MKKAVTTPKAPTPVGPYSQAVKAGEFLFISGVLGINMINNTLGKTVAEQTRFCLENMTEILKEAGGNMDDIVKTTILLSDMKDFAEINKVYAGFFKEPYPARAAYQVAELPLKAMVEIEAVARMKER